MTSRPPREGAAVPAYERDPAAIYRRSFEIIRDECTLDHLPDQMKPLAIRMIHASGMIDLADDLRFSADAQSVGRKALNRGAAILVDCVMLKAGIIRRHLSADNEIISTIDDPRATALAAVIGNTRSAAAVELWRDVLEGAVVAIGNAPTALFHLLELLDQGWPRPALILGFPVGFVGAAAAKETLAANPRGVPFLTLAGRHGGSAIAAAAVNALAAGLKEAEA
jgi:precorrin-8X/cobalt-precorrin-8 methylmutase